MPRKLLLAFLILALPVLRAPDGPGALLHLSGPALASEGSDGGSDGGGDGGGSDSGSGSDGGGDDGGGSDSGSGSGSDGGGDDGSSGHGGGDDDGDDDSHSGHGSSDDDSDEADDEGNEHSQSGLFGGRDSGGGGRDGPSYRAHEIVAYALTNAQRGVLARAGFRALGDYRLAALGQRVTRLGVPPGLDAEEGLVAASALLPNALLALNHLYAPEGTRCDPSACWAAELVGLAPLAADACRAAAPLAIVDTAVALGHPALDGARIVTRSFLDGAEAAAPPAHGTAIAALLVGERNAGAPALAPGAELLVAEAFSGEGEGTRADAVAILRGLDWAIASGARVVGLSFAGSANPILELGVQAAAGRANLVAAAGNDGPGGAPAYPAAYPQVMAVAAVDARQRPYRRGTRGAYLDIAAPGVGIRSADAGGGTANWSGTSFSVPFVMAALSRARAETGGDPAAARALIDARARDLGAPGRDEVYGYGLLQAPGDGCR